MNYGEHALAVACGEAQKRRISKREAFPEGVRGCRLEGNDRG
jgi:hypothetical protein